MKNYAPYAIRVIAYWHADEISIFLSFYYFILPLFFSFSIFRSCRPFVPAVPCGDAWYCNTFSIKSIVCCRSMPKSMKVHSIPSRLYSSCSRMNMWWLKNCWSFSLVKLMHNCSKLLNCSRPRRGGKESKQRTKVKKKKRQLSLMLLTQTTTKKKYWGFLIFFFFFSFFFNKLFFFFFHRIIVI